jgi:hypothetical protein
VQKKWLFTVMKIDTMQMKRNKDGTFAGEVTPTRFQFTSDKLVYPLKITQISVREKTEALFYVQAPFKVDLPGDMTYQYTWVPMLQGGERLHAGRLAGPRRDWLEAFKGQIPPLLARAQELNFRFVSRPAPAAEQQGHIPTTMEWARKLTKDDRRHRDRQIALQRKSPRRRRRLHPRRRRTRAGQGDRQGHPRPPGQGAARSGRSAIWCARRPADDVKNLQQLAGHLTRKLVHHQVPQDFRARRDERRPGDGARQL